MYLYYRALHYVSSLSMWWDLLINLQSLTQKASTWNGHFCNILDISIDCLNIFREFHQENASEKYLGMYNSGQNVNLKTDEALAHWLKSNKWHSDCRELWGIWNMSLKSAIIYFSFHSIFYYHVKIVKWCFKYLFKLWNNNHTAFSIQVCTYHFTTFCF